MTSVKEMANNYEPKKTLNISDLPSFDTNEPTETRKGESNGEEYEFDVLVRDGQDYRIPTPVKGQIKDILNKNKDVKVFQVIKSGDGKQTRYTTIPVMN